MSENTKEVNYTPEQEAAIIAASPLNLESAKAMGETMGKSYRSIIAKALNLGQEYNSKPAPAKRIAQETKAEIVAEIAKIVEANSLLGLEKATVKSLCNLREAVSAFFANEETELA